MVIDNRLAKILGRISVEGSEEELGDVLTQIGDLVS